MLPTVSRIFLCSQTATLLVWLCLIFSSNAQQAQPSEYQVKAALIFNFAKFVEWPAAAFQDDKSPLYIGVLGDNPFGADLEMFIRDKSISDHPVAMRECHTLEEAKKCHILFISTSETKRLPEIFAALQGATVLTVGETEAFAEAGGIVNFVYEGKKIRFQINDTVAKSAGLKISAKLLSLASGRRASSAATPPSSRTSEAVVFGAAALVQPPMHCETKVLLTVRQRFAVAAVRGNPLCAIAGSESQLRVGDADRNVS